MTGAEYAAQVRWLSKANATTFLDADIVRLTNIWLRRICRHIDKVNAGFFSMEAKWDLVADQREYQLPVGMMSRLEKLSIKFPAWENYRRCVQQELSGFWEWPTDETSIITHSSDAYPRFFLRRNSIILLTGSAVPDLADGIWAWFKAYPSSIAVATLSAVYELDTPPMPTAIGIPEEIQDLLATRLSIDFKSSKDRPMGINTDEARYELELQRVIESLVLPNLEQETVAKLPYDDGSDY